MLKLTNKKQIRQLFKIGFKLYYYNGLAYQLITQKLDLDLSLKSDGCVWIDRHVLDYITIKLEVE